MLPGSPGRRHRVQHHAALLALGAGHDRLLQEAVRAAQVGAQRARHAPLAGPSRVLQASRCLHLPLLSLASMAYSSGDAAAELQSTCPAGGLTCTAAMRRTARHPPVCCAPRGCCSSRDREASCGRRCHPVRRAPAVPAILSMLLCCQCRDSTLLCMRTQQPAAKHSAGLACHRCSSWVRCSCV